MRSLSHVLLYVTLGVVVLSLGPSREALSDDPPLPTDGIDDPAPGPLALPARIKGPDGRDLVRSVTLRSAATALEVLTRYEAPEQSGDLQWRVTIHAFDRKGLAHKELHRALTRTSSLPLPPWHEQLEQVTGAPAIMLHAKAHAGNYFGVVRQCYVRVDVGASRSLPTLDLRALAARYDAVTRDLAFRVWRMVQDASSALRPMKAAFVKLLSVDHEYNEEEARSQLVVRMEPGPEFGSERSYRFNVFASGRGSKPSASAETLQRRPLAIIEFSRASEPGLKSREEADPSGATVRVLRLIEGDPLAIEEINLTAGPRGSRVVKRP